MTDRILTASHRGDIELVANFGQTGFYIKKFLLDDTANKNNWQAMWPAIKKYAASFVGQPVVLTPQMDHPDPKIQHIHAVGKIIDVGLDEEKKAAWQISRIDNPYVQQAIIDRDITYGSVSLSAPEDEIRDVGGVAVVSGRFLGRHDALVASPAYGEKDVISAACSGEEGPCIKKLLSAATSDTAMDQATIQKFHKRLSAMELRVVLLHAKGFQPNPGEEPDDQGRYWRRMKDGRAFFFRKGEETGGKLRRLAKEIRKRH